MFLRLFILFSWLGLAAAAGSLQIVTPPPGEIVQTAAETIDLRGTLADVRAIQRMEVYFANGAWAGIQPGSTWEVDKVPLRPGLNTITVAAVDRSGHAVEVKATVFRSSLEVLEQVSRPRPVSLVEMGGRVVAYEVAGDWAVVSGDIILGRVKEIAEAKDRERAALGVHRSLLWPNGLIPYEFEGSPPPEWRQRMEQAMRAWERETPIRFVERTAQAVYLRCRTLPEGGLSSLGISFFGSPMLGVGLSEPLSTFIHELGHAIGLGHTHQRGDRDRYLVVNRDSITARWLDQYDSILESAWVSDVGPYDYGSIMHYPPAAGTIDTIPSGLLFNPSVRSAPARSDVEAVQRIYGQPPATYTVTTFPSGLEFTVDGQTYRSEQRFNWQPGAEHRIGAPAVQGTGSSRWTFARWSDDGAREHTVTASPGTTLYIANFARQCQVRLDERINPFEAAYTLTPYAADGYYPCYSAVTAHFAGQTGFTLMSWLSAGLGGRSSVRFQPADVSFVSPQYTQSPTVTVNSPVEGALVTVNGRTQAPPVVNVWPEGSRHTISAPAIQPVRAGMTEAATRHIFARWRHGGDREQAYVATGGAAELVAEFRTEHRIAVDLWPEGRGTIDFQPPGADNQAGPRGTIAYFPSGTEVQMLASSAPGTSFLCWGGAVAGTHNPAILEVSRPAEVQGFFGQASLQSIFGVIPQQTVVGTQLPHLSLQGSFEEGLTEVFWNGSPRRARFPWTRTHMEVLLEPDDLSRAADVVIEVRTRSAPGPAQRALFRVVPQLASCRFTLAAPAAPIPSGGGLLQIPVTAGAGCWWSPASDSEWVAVQNAWPKEGSGSVNFWVEPNGSSRPRSAVLRAGGASVTVTQQGVPCQPTVRLSAGRFGAAGGEGRLAVQQFVADCAWTAASDAPWLTIQGASTGSGNGILAFALERNAGPPRTARLTVAGVPMVVEQEGGGLPVSSVTGILQAASYRAGAVAPDSFVSLFGANLAAALAVAEASPLPLALGGIEVLVRDSAGVERPAPLHFVASTQINLLLPGETALGPAVVTVRRQGQAVASAALSVDSVSPGIFTANGTGNGPPNASLVRARASGQQTSEPVFVCREGICEPRPIDVADPAATVVLVLYGTGLRRAASVGAVIGGTAVPVLFAGPQGAEGLDQVNLLLTPSLAGKGLVEAQLNADGKAANPVSILIRAPD